MDNIARQTVQTLINKLTEASKARRIPPGASVTLPADIVHNPYALPGMLEFTAATMLQSLLREIELLAQDSPAQSTIAPSITEVGKFIDAKARNAPQQRDVRAVAGRLLEETVELCLEAGLTTGTIFGHIADAVANEAWKQSRQKNFTVFPSELRVVNATFLWSEIADVQLVMKDLCYIAEIDENCSNHLQRDKWQAFTAKEFTVARNGCLYAKKPHITNRP